MKFHRMAGLTAGALAVFMAGGVSAATLAGPFVWHFAYQGKTVSGQLVKGPAGSYVSLSAIARLFGTKETTNTAGKTVTFAKSGSGSRSVGASSGGSPSTKAHVIYLQTLPNSVIFVGNLAGWQWVTPAKPITTIDQTKFTQGVRTSYSCNGNNTPGVAFGPTYLANGQYSAVTFSLGLPSSLKNESGYGVVQVFAGNSSADMSLVYTSPDVGRGFFTKRVTVQLPATRLVRIVTLLHTNCNSNNGLHGMVLGNAGFIARAR